VITQTTQAALLIGLIAWLEPMRLTAELGQINIVLLVLVVGDLLATAQSKWSGVGIGLAAGLKLTPALFIVYLLVTRRIRAALVATATFAGMVGLGFAVAPSDSVSYWLHGRFDDVNQISHDPLANTSLGGLVLRLHGSPTAATVAGVVPNSCPALRFSCSSWSWSARWSGSGACATTSA
jgi:alpha-1,2-mannosyltransferase